MASIDGLASGIDTSGLIKSLMQLERQPQLRLQTERSKLVRTNSLYQELNRQMGAIATASKAITGLNGWEAAKASSSDASRVAVTASASATPGTVTFTVDQLAKAGSSVSADTVNGKDTVVVDPATTPTIFLRKDGIDTEVDVGDGKLSTIVANVNAAGAGISATAVNVGDTDADGTSEYRLQLVSTTTGASSDVTVTDAAGGAGANPFATTLGAMNTLVAGSNAVLRVGGNGDGTGGYTIERTSNTFSDVLDGVTFTLAKADQAADVTVGVTNDTGAIADRVGKLVSAVNAALTGMAKQQAYDPETKTAGPLIGDSLVQRLRTTLVRAASDPVAGNDVGSPGRAGVSVQRDGTLKFDKDAFIAQYEKDPAAVRELLGEGAGVAGRLEALAASTKTQVDATIKARTNQLPIIDGRISNWDRRLEVREQTLRSQFEAMEVALGRMNQQSSWLAGQLGQLNANSGGN